MIFQIFLNIPGRGVLMLSRTDTDMMQPSDRNIDSWQELKIASTRQTTVPRPISIFKQVWLRSKMCKQLCSSHVLGLEEPAHKPVQLHSNREPSVAQEQDQYNLSSLSN